MLALVDYGTNAAGTTDWLRVSKNVGISVYEPTFRASVATTSNTNACLAENAAIRLSLLSFEQDWNAPGMEIYDHL
jgi:hypothetical protein